MHKGLFVYASPLAICLVISLSVLVMEIGHEAGTGIDALFSATAYFQCLWVSLAFSFLMSALALRVSHRWAHVALHAAAIPMAVLWYVLASKPPMVQFDLFRVLLIVLFYASALSLLPCGDSTNFSRFLMDAAQKSVAAFAAVTILFFGVILLVLTAGTLFSEADVPFLSMIPNAAAILYGILLPLLMAGVLVPRQSYAPHNKIFKKFITYGLLPILAGLGVIFYAYLIKILVTGVWPSNQVSPFVIFGSCVGAVFIVYFCGEEDAVARGFRRIFPLFWLLPLSMLFVCAAMRIHQHGLTPMRGLLLLFGIWMLAVLLCMILQKERFHTKTLPLLLTALLATSLFLPYGNLFSISKHTQLARLDRALLDADMGTHNSISPNGGAANEQRAVILSAADYLLGETDAVLRSVDGTTIRMGEYDRAFGFSNVPQREETSYRWYSSEFAVLDTRNTQAMLTGLSWYEGAVPYTAGEVEGLGTIICEEDYRITIESGGDKQVFALEEAMQRAAWEAENNVEDWYIIQPEAAPFRLVIQELSCDLYDNGTIELYNVDFALLILAQ